MIRAAVMQPTFLPWLGYFALIEFVDVFVLFDNAQFSKQSWHSRNRIKTSNGVLILSVPCKRRLRPINEIFLADNFSRKSMLRTIKHAYFKAPFRDEVTDLIEKVFSQNHTKICDLNCELIHQIIELLDIKTKIILSSQLNIPKLEKSILSLRFCEELNADQFISPISAFSYLRESNPFENSDKSLRFFSFEHPVYPQLYGKFESHLSVIDTIANVGIVETKKLIVSATQPPKSISQVEVST